MMKFSMAFVALIMLPAIAHGVPLMPTTGPTHEWRFDEGTGTSAADDGTPGGADATLGAGGWAPTPDAKFGASALAVRNSTANTALTGNIVGLSANSTISLWFRYDGAATKGNPYLFDDFPTNHADIRLWTNRVDPEVGSQYLEMGGLVWNGSSTAINSLPNITDTDWHHLVVVSGDFDGDTNADDLKVYLDYDGTNAGTNVVQMNNIGGAINIPDFRLGNGNNNNVWAGDIDDVGIWQSTLLDAEIEWLGQNSLSSIGSLNPVPEPGAAMLVGLGGLITAVALVVRRRRK